MYVVVADFGERQRPVGPDCDARIRRTTLHCTRNAIYNLLWFVFRYHLFQVPMKWERSFQTVNSFLVFKYSSKSCLNYILFQTSFLHSRQKDWGAKGVYNAVSSFFVLVRPGKQADFSNSKTFST